MSVVTYLPDHPFPIQNLPYGVFVHGNSEPHIGVAIGDFILDLYKLSSAGAFFPDDVTRAFQQPVLNAFMALNWETWKATRETITKILSTDGVLAQNAALKDSVLVVQTEVKMVLAVNIGDYTDCYASREHASNVGKMFRPTEKPLMDNWLYIPVAYHGRASSVVVSGTPIVRPCGQKRPDPSNPPVFGPSAAVDFELEMGAYIGTGNALGEPIKIEDAQKYIFGFSLFNDWSARDIQRWEYVPLGPFLGKNFGSTISPWIVTTFALEPFRVPVHRLPEDPQPLPYLQESIPSNYDVKLSVTITTAQDESMIVSQSNMKYMHWSMYQQLAHHTCNGCNMRPGDLIGSGTLSGSEEGTLGSMLELAWNGTRPITFPSGAQRKMIQDGDVVTFNGECVGEGYRIGFGECSGRLLPAKPF